MTLVGDNNNKGTAPSLIIYRRLLLITPTRAGVDLIVLLFDGKLTLSCSHGLCPHKPSINHIPMHPTPAREAGTTIIESTTLFQRTVAREAGET
jgi:hypothetical protein